MNIEAILERRGRKGWIKRPSYDGMPMPLGPGERWPVGPEAFLVLEEGGPEWESKTAPVFKAPIKVAVVVSGAQGSDMSAGSAMLYRGKAIIAGSALEATGWPFPPKNGDVISVDGKDWMIRSCVPLYWNGQVACVCDVEG